MTSNIILELKDDFSEDFFEVLHILVGPKIKILENHFNFLNLSVDMPGRFYNRLVLSYRKFEHLKKNSQNISIKSHV